MKKALPNTKVTVKLRRSNYKEEWYLIIESSQFISEVLNGRAVWSKVYRLLRHTFFVRKKKKMCIWIHFRVEFII